LQSNMLTN